MTAQPPDIGRTTFLVNQLRAGDPLARQRLVEHSCGRLHKLASRMLRRRPELRRWEQTDDLMQNALIRLCRALESVEVQSSEHFHRLAAQQLRWETLDLSKKHLGPEGLGANHHTDHAKQADNGEGIIDRAAAPGEPSTLAEWTHFHETVAALPDDEREVVELRWYQGLSQCQIAPVIGVCTKTVQRRWVSAMCLIGRAMRDYRGQ